MNDYLKIYPPSVDKESLFLDTLSKIFTNFPLNITKQILSDNLPIILSCQDKNIFTNLTQVLSNYNFKYEFLSQIEENSLDKKRLLIVINTKNPNVYTLVNMYTLKSTQELFTEELIDTDTLNSLNTVKCNKCDNITPSDLNFCIFCAEDIFKEFEQRYTLQVTRFSNKNPDNDKIKVKKFFYEIFQMNFEESNKILNNLPCYLSFDSSKETAEFIKSTLSSFNIDCKYVSENESQDWLNKLWNIFKWNKNYYLGTIQNPLFTKPTLKLIKDITGTIKSNKLKKVITVVIIEAIAIINAVRSSNKVSQSLLQEIIEKQENIIKRICNFIVKIEKIENYLNDNKPFKLQREVEKLLYNISQVNDSITKQMYLETLAIKEKEIDNFENLKLIFKRLEAQILHLISSLKNIRSQIINLLLLELEINKFKSSNILQSIEELDNNIITIEEVLSYQYN